MPETPPNEQPIFAMTTSSSSNIAFVQQITDGTTAGFALQRFTNQWDETYLRLPMLIATDHTPAAVTHEAVYVDPRLGPVRVVACAAASEVPAPISALPGIEVVDAAECAELLETCDRRCEGVQLSLTSGAMLRAILAVEGFGL